MATTHYLGTDMNAKRIFFTSMSNSFFEIGQKKQTSIFGILYFEDCRYL